jgi:cold shock CspA family protein
MPTPLGVRRSGRVLAFDDSSGLGEVADDGDARWPFHCSAVADGTRSVAVGAIVAFSLVPGRAGRWEASDLRPAS